jgi:hypothetical protein
MDQMELQERMSLTTKGQVTWADPSKGMKCTVCAHLQAAPPSDLGANKMLKNRCALVKLHTKKKGALFNGKTAIACSMFSM